MPVILALRWLKQEDSEFEASLGNNEKLLQTNKQTSQPVSQLSSKLEPGGRARSMQNAGTGWKPEG